MKNLFRIPAIAVLILVLGFSLSSCQQEKDTRLIILHTNDMHAHINNFGKLAAYVEKTRAENKNVILVSAGDLFSGNPVVDQYPEKGFPQIDLMNKVGFRLNEYGNHEFDYGQEILAKRITQANFPFICANIKVEQGPLKQPAPDYIWKIDGLKVAFLGLLETSIDNLPATDPEKIKGLAFPKALTIAGNYDSLKDHNNAVIALSHLGVESDMKLAEKYPYFTAIVGGHSHTIIKNPKETNGVLITQAGDYLNYVGKLTLVFRNGQVVSKTDTLINLNTYPDSDPYIDSLIDKYNNNESLNQVIGQALKPVRGKDELGSLFTDAVRAKGNCDFAFQNNGGIRIREIPQGPVTMKTIYELDPFGNEIVSLEMNYNELKSLISHSYKLHNRPELQISGGKYEVILDKSGKYKDVIIKDNSGRLLRPGKEYKVGLSSYVVSAYKFDHRDPGKSMMITTAESIIQYIRKVHNLDYSGVKRVSIKKID